jgi:hypothetical protein
MSAESSWQTEPTAYDVSYRIYLKLEVQAAALTGIDPLCPMKFIVHIPLPMEISNVNEKGII